MTAVVGYAIGKLTGGDVKALLTQLMDGVFRFLREQGPYVSFALVMSVALGWLAVWAIRMLVNGKQAEIDRVALERDKFQKLFIDHWHSTMKPKGAKK